MALSKPTDAQLDAAVKIPDAKSVDERHCGRYDLCALPSFSPPSPVSFLPPSFSFRRQAPNFDRINAEIATLSIDSSSSSSSSPPPPPEPPGQRRRNSSLRLVDPVAGVATLSTHVCELPAWTLNAASEPAASAATRPEDLEYDLGGRIRSNHSLSEFASPFRERSVTPEPLRKSPSNAIVTTDSSVSYSVPGSFVERVRNLGPAPHLVPANTGVMDKQSTKSGSSGSGSTSSQGSSFGSSSSSSSSGSSFMTKFYQNFTADSKRELNIMAPLSS